MDEDHPLKNHRNNFHLAGLEGWASNFEKALPTSRGPTVAPGLRPRYFEATTHLIYQKTALQVLPTLSSNPRFIFLLRDPVQRLRSSFAYTHENLGRIAGDLSFDKYVQCVLSGEQKRLERHIPHSGSAFVLQRDLQYGDYWKYLRNWSAALGPERILVVQLERLRAEPRIVLRECFEFLGVPGSNIAEGLDLTRKNETHAVRSRRLQRWARRISQLVPTGASKQWLKSHYQRIQSSPRLGDPALHCSQETADSLNAYYEVSRRELAAHFSLNLDLWQ